jgi:hypothetical protein
VTGTRQDSTSAVAPVPWSTSQGAPSENPGGRPTVEDMNTALVTVTLSAAIAAAAVAVRARVAPRRVSVRVPAQSQPDEAWHPHVSAGCGR